MIFVYSWNLFLCLHLAINSNRWFNNFSGSGYIIICIFSSRHGLHLLSKHFGVFEFFNMDHWISGVKPLFFKLQKCLDWLGCLVFQMLMGERKFMISVSRLPFRRRNPCISFSILIIFFWVNDSLVYYII